MKYTLRPDDGCGNLKESCASDTKPMSTPSRVCARLGIALLLFVCTSGCTIQESCDLYNNSGSDVTIVRSGAGQEEPPIQLKSGASILLPDWLFAEYQLEMDGKVFRYTPKSPDPSFIDDRGFGPWAKRVFSAQLDSSGRIFVLKQTQSIPATEFVEQPSGFPLMPVISR